MVTDEARILTVTLVAVTNTRVQDAHMYAVYHKQESMSHMIMSAFHLVPECKKPILFFISPL